MYIKKTGTAKVPPRFHPRMKSDKWERICAAERNGGKGDFGKKVFWNKSF
jgi:hypothetical protein